MPSYNTSLKMQNSHGSTVGQILKQQADLVTEETWENDIQSKKAYIYDYYHDDQPYRRNHITYDLTTKHAIDIKFIVTQYGTLAKDQVEYHIMFRPSEPVEFNEGDELYYYEKEYRNRYSADYPIGLYIDIPNEKGIYEKWLICGRDGGNQFYKYTVLPVNYYLTWIEWENNKRIKRKMWCVRRSQNSYNSGLWTSYYTTTVENQSKIWLPINDITEKLSYTWNINGQIINQRLVMSVLTKTPNVWKISKVENAQPFGLQQLTIYQDQWNPNTDYIDWENGEMYADYNLSEVTPDTSVIDEPKMINIASLTASTDKIKIGGSYKLITLSLTDDNNIDITSKYIDLISSESWTCYIDDADMTDDALITWLPQPKKNQIKIKIADNKSYTGKVLIIKCYVMDNIIGTIKLQMV